MKTMRRRNGFTMLELIAVLVVIGILGSVAAFATLQARTTTKTMMGERLLNQVASAQEEHYRQRGAWIVDPSSFAATADGVTITSGASSGPDVVSVSEAAGADDVPAVNLAVVTDEGVCVTMHLLAPGRGEARLDRFMVSPTRSCSAGEA